MLDREFGTGWFFVGEMNSHHRLNRSYVLIPAKF